MKILKVLSTSAIAAALLATCGVSAFAVDAPAIDENLNTNIVLGDGEEGGDDLEEGDDGDLDEGDGDLDGEEGDLDDGDGDLDDGDGDLDDGDGDLDDGDGDLDDGDGDEISDEDWAAFAQAVEDFLDKLDKVDISDAEGNTLSKEVVGNVLVSESESELCEALGNGKFTFFYEGVQEFTVWISEGEIKEVTLATTPPDDTDGDDDFHGFEDGDDDDDWFGGKKEKKDNDVEYNKQDVVNAAFNAGVTDVNVMTLRNFLILNDDYFDSDDYADFIDSVNEIRDLYIAPIAASLFYKTPGQLTASERYDVYDQLTKAEKDAIQADFIDLAKDHGVLLTFDRDANGYPMVYASILGKTEDAGTKASSGTQVATGTSAVKDTGDVPQEGTSSAAAFAGVALALAAAGVVIVARKNRA